MTGLAKYLGRMGLTTRLLVGGAFIAVGLWWVLDVVHSNRIERTVRLQVMEQLQDDAQVDRLRLDAAVRAHFTFTRLIANYRAAARHAEKERQQGRIVRLIGEPAWLPPRADRRFFPLIDFLLLTDSGFQALEVHSVGGNPASDALLNIGKRVLTMAEEQPHIVTIGGRPHLVSVSAIGGAGNRLVAVSEMNSRFLVQALGPQVRRGNVVALIDNPSGIVLASTDPTRLATNNSFAELEQDWLVAGQDFFDYGSSEVVVKFVTLYPLGTVAARSRGLLTIEREQRTVLALVLSGLMLCVLLVLAIRLRAMIRHVAAVSSKVLGTAPELYLDGNELNGLVRQVESLSAAVEASREALARETADRIQLLTDRMQESAEIERLGLLKGVTDLVGVGVARLTEDGPVAENQIMARFAAECGGIELFLRGKAQGLDDLCLTATDGSARVFHLALARSIDPGLLLVEDVTERRRAEEAVASLALFPAQNPNPVLRVSIDGTVMEANPASTALLAEWGVSPGGRASEKWLDIFSSAMSEGTYRIVEISVGDRVLALTLVPLPGMGYLNIYAYDVTDRVEAELELQRINEELEERVATRTRDLSVAKDAAELANRAKTEFLAAVSHELRTPLNAIIGFSEVMVGGMFGPLTNPRYQEYAQDIHSSGSHLLDVINDILDVAKAEKGQMTLVQEPMVTKDVVAAAIRLIDNRARGEGVQVTAEVQEVLPPISADRRRVLQILVNLLSNAVKFTPQGGHVNLRVVAETGWLRIEVADDGIGMQPEEVDLALASFRQVDGSLARRFEGVGLGLPLARSFAELHGGSLWIASQPGQGTVVTVMLPAEPALAEAVS